MKRPFLVIFSFRVNKNLLLQNHVELTLCKKNLFETLTLKRFALTVSVNSFHTLAVEKSIL